MSLEPFRIQMVNTKNFKSLKFQDEYVETCQPVQPAAASSTFLPSGPTGRVPSDSPVISPPVGLEHLMTLTGKTPYSGPASIMKSKDRLSRLQERLRHSA
eukprot:2700047-Amphidinium_carterae.5